MIKRETIVRLGELIYVFVDDTTRDQLVVGFWPSGRFLPPEDDFVDKPLDFVEQSLQLMTCEQLSIPKDRFFPISLMTRRDARRTPRLEEYSHFSVDSGFALVESALPYLPTTKVSTKVWRFVTPPRYLVNQHALDYHTKHRGI